MFLSILFLYVGLLWVMPYIYATNTIFYMDVTGELKETHKKHMHEVADWIPKELEDTADERDLYLTMRTSHVLLKITNYVLCTFTFLFLIAYSAWKASSFLIISMTLCAVTVFIFIAFLCINIYFEKNE